MPISQLGESTPSSSSSTSEGRMARLDLVESRALSAERDVRELRSQFDELSVLLRNLRQDFDQLIQDHLIPLQARGERSCQQCHIVRTSTALLLGSLFPDLGSLLQRRGGLFPRLSGSESSSEPTSPSSSLPTLDTPSSDSHDEEYYPAPRTTNVSPILKEAGSSNVSFRSVGDGGSEVWEVLNGGGARADSV